MIKIIKIKKGPTSKSHLFKRKKLRWKSLTRIVRKVSNQLSLTK